MGKSEAKAMWVSHKCEYTIYICIFLHLYPLPTINCTKLYAQEYILKCISAIIHQLNIITLTHKSTLFIPLPTKSWNNGRKSPVEECTFCIVSSFQAGNCTESTLLHRWCPTVISRLDYKFIDLKQFRKRSSPNFVTEYRIFSKL